ncbi:aromatic ring-hydroxylating dioxygenase subunit alpha [Falsiroseomonas oryzae]|uniref:aromatic ring-hydroxylating dioxygenase subunit alpha n=1 Tax=Falsiroseomonas oryzae TaxID=2766473 RepID=UPI0022EA8CA0|nr:aromatic ring-hydroxylating dioxygenase subunit alpha [Roseomonas sp. MO-31]
MRTAPAPYSGYHRPLDAPEDAEITRTGRGTPLGELFRRHWQPVALASRIGVHPLALRVLGEDLVLFRSPSGTLGLLHRHCAHRGASLEYGRVEERGLRCCYHGWLFAHDGRLLEAPGEREGTPLLRTACQGAYPVQEVHGLVFAYLGPPEHRPPFPRFDTIGLPDVELVPYSLHYPCNWLQVHENQMDPMHAVFLHTRMGETHFTPAWGEMPVLIYGTHRDRTYYVAVRRVGDHVWVRINEVIVPNVGQVAALWESGEVPRIFQRVGITRWTVPADDESCWILGWRHFGPEVEPPGLGQGNRSLVGHDSLDIYGQSGHRPYAEMQANPGDWEAQVSQRPIAIHALEHRGATDVGVVTLRRQLRAALAGQVDPRQPHGLGSGEDPLPTMTCNVVFARAWTSPPGSAAEREQLKQLGTLVRDAVIAADDLAPDERQAAIGAAISRIAVC